MTLETTIAMSGKEQLPYRSPSPSVEPDHLLAEEDHDPTRKWPDGPDHRRDDHPGHGRCIFSLADIVFCASNGMRPLLIAGAMFFPVGIVHGIGAWFGGW